MNRLLVCSAYIRQKCCKHFWFLPWGDSSHHSNARINCPHYLKMRRFRIYAKLNFYPLYRIHSKRTPFASFIYSLKRHTIVDHCSAKQWWRDVNFFLLTSHNFLVCLLSISEPELISYAFHTHCIFYTDHSLSHYNWQFVHNILHAYPLLTWFEGLRVKLVNRKLRAKASKRMFRLKMSTTWPVVWYLLIGNYFWSFDLIGFLI